MIKKPPPGGEPFRSLRLASSDVGRKRSSASATGPSNHECIDLDLHKYQSSFAASLQQKHIDRYQDQVVCFRTILEEIDL